MIRTGTQYVDKAGALTQAGYQALKAVDDLEALSATLQGQIATLQGQVTALQAADATEAANAPGSAPRYACRAWVNFNGTGTVAIRASGNVASITDNGTGDYTINFATPMPDADYAVVATGTGVPNHPAVGASVKIGVAPTATSVRLQFSTTGGVGSVGDPRDVEFASVAIFR